MIQGESKLRRIWANIPYQKKREMALKAGLMKENDEIPKVSTEAIHRMMNDCQQEVNQRVVTK